MKRRIYMDYQATTPVDERVLETMLPYFRQVFGNAASRNHSFGWEADDAVEKAREQVANLMGASAKEIVFTSGATESINLAIKGVAEMYADKGKHIITEATEHKAVLDTCKTLERRGYDVTFLPVGADGRVQPEQVRDAITGQTILVSVMHGNNEIGVVNPIREIGAICRERGVFFMTDSTQSVGKIPFDVDADNVDLATISAHKIYGPKGVGALYVRRRKPRVRLAIQMDGGGHERGMRSGTLNVPGIVGLGKACELCAEEGEAERQRLTGLRDRLLAKIRADVPEIKVNGSMEHHLPHNLNISFAYVEGESLLMGIEEIAVSSGSACTSASLEPSYVLRAIGVGDDLAHSSVRFGLGRFTTEEEVDYVAKRVAEEVARLREMSPLWEMFQEGIDPSTVEWSGH